MDYSLHGPYQYQGSGISVLQGPTEELVQELVQEIVQELVQDFIMEPCHSSVIYSQEPQPTYSLQESRRGAAVD